MAKGDAMGKQVSSIYISLGLNADDLQLGFKVAGQTVKQAIARLNSEANQIRLRADIDVTRLEAAGKHVDALKAREKALNDELTIQQKKLELLNRAYEYNAKTFGTDHGNTRGVETKRLYQTRDIERLKTQIAALNAELGKTETKATTAFGKLKAEAAKANGSVKSMVSSIGAVNAKIAAVSGAIAGGAGLFSLTDEKKKKGNDLYLLTTRLHTTAAEAGKLQKMFTIAGVDVNAGISALVRLDKQALSAGDSENTLTKAMQEFGFTLTDSQGNLLPYFQQLEQVSKGFMKAAAAGKEAEFMAATFGAKGAGLAPLLQDFEMLREVVNGIQSTGLMDPQASRELFIEWNKMKYQMAQMTGAVGQAMLPIAKELMPEITETFKEFTLLIKDNTADIKEFGSAAGSVLGGVATATVKLISLLGKLKGLWNDVTGLSKNEEIIRANGGDKALDALSVGGGVFGAVMGSFFGPTGTAVGALLGKQLFEDAGIIGARLGARSDWDKYAANAERKKLLEQEKKAFEDYDKQAAESKKIAAQTQNPEALAKQSQALNVQKRLEQELSQATTARLREQLEAIREKVRESIASGKEEADAWIKAEAEITNAVKSAMAEAQKANEELEKSIYSLSHSDLQNNLHGVESAAKAMLERGADPELVAQDAELKRSQIIRQFNDETAAYLDSIYENSLQQRLNQIEREKQAWIQKGLDEVRATQAAEQKKRSAMNDSVKNMFTSQKKYLDIYRKAMMGDISSGGMQIYDFGLSEQQKKQNAINAIRRQMMKEAGVDPNEMTDMKEITGFLNALKEAENWGLSLIRDGGNLAGGEGTAAIHDAMVDANGQIESLLGDVSSRMPDISTTLSGILDAVQNQQPPSINVSPSINVDLGGAYVFDDNMKQQLTNDIATEVANGVRDAVANATSRLNTSYAG